MEAIGRGQIALPLLDFVMVGGALLAQAGSDAQKLAWLADILAGDRRVALAHAEHGARFALTGGATVSNGRISGDKTFVPAPANAWIVTARDGETIGLYLVEESAPGVSTRDYRLMDGSSAVELTLREAPCLPMPGGVTALERVLERARIAAVAEMVGLMDRLFHDTLTFVRDRRQFGQPIGGFQAIQHRLADQFAALELSRSHLLRGALATEDRDAAIAGAKAFVSKAAIRLGEECIQFHGGMGTSEELSIGRGHKRLLVLASFFGDADHERRRFLATRGKSPVEAPPARTDRIATTAIGA